MARNIAHPESYLFGVPLAISHQKLQPHFLALAANLRKDVQRARLRSFCSHSRVNPCLAGRRNVSASVLQSLSMGR